MNDTKESKSGILGNSMLAKVAEPYVQDILNNPEKLQGVLDKFGIKMGEKKDPTRPEWR